MQSYRDLGVWQKSYALARSMYRATAGFPRAEIFGLTSQLRRATSSIPANIAEGYGRRTRADYLRFLNMAQGSVGEIDTLLSLATDLLFLPKLTGERLAGEMTEVRMMLTGLVQSLSRGPGSGPTKGGGRE